MRKAHRLLLLSGLTLGMLVAVTGCDGDDGGGAGGSGATGGTGGTGGQGGQGGDTGAVPRCEDYCNAIMANCVDDNQQYSTMESCMGSCAAFELGKLTDTSGNTLGCRIYHAGAAEGDPATHCSHAGPGGADMCGSDLDGFCAIAVSACPNVYADETSCRETAMTFPDTAEYSTSATVGDTLACRLYHVTVAASSPGSAEMHCPHVGPPPVDGMNYPCQ